LLPFALWLFVTAIGIHKAKEQRTCKLCTFDVVSIVSLPSNSPSHHISFTALLSNQILYNFSVLYIS
jgi:hypothetical protein